MKSHNDFIKTNKLKQYKRTVLSIPTDEGHSYKCRHQPDRAALSAHPQTEKACQPGSNYNTCGRSRTVCTDGECWGLWVRHSSARIESKS